MPEVSGWGRHPRVEARLHRPPSVEDCRRLLAAGTPLIPRGLGRSYGDSSLAADVLETRRLDRFVDFDAASGELECEAGVPLADILQVFVPRGWFLPVVPGTRFVTVGGAVASDVHGKNHHRDGSFGDHVLALTMLLGNGEQVRASRDQHADLFHATCSGMGLTGLIVSVRLRLKRVRSSRMHETSLRLPDLGAVLRAFDDHAASTYSVAWIDCAARGRSLGRSLLMLGEHADDGELGPHRQRPRTLPVDLPPQLLNAGTVRAFNALYYRRVPAGGGRRTVHYEPWFFPLDALLGWNRLYGRRGFVQYQFVLPRAAGESGLARVLERVAASGRASFLAVLKVLSTANRNLLSFPMEGFTLAMDFKAEPAVFALLDELDALVLSFGGRIYLTKDSRMRADIFKASYPQWRAFEAVRERHHAAGRFASLQSQRLGLA